MLYASYLLPFMPGQSAVPPRYAFILHTDLQRVQRACLQRYAQPGECLQTLHIWWFPGV